MPAARGHLPGVSAQTFGVQPFNRPLYQRREILPAAGQCHSLDEEAERIRSRHAIDQCSGIILWRQLFSRMLFGRTSDIQHVTACSFDEQRFLGAKIICDLAWEGVGCRRNVGNRNGGQPLLLKQPTRGIQQTRAHSPARGRVARTVCLGSLKRSFGAVLFKSRCIVVGRDKTSLYGIQTNSSRG